jgi:hypothetical protein
MGPGREGNAREGDRADAILQKQPQDVCASHNRQKTATYVPSGQYLSAQTLAKFNSSRWSEFDGVYLFAPSLMSNCGTSAGKVRTKNLAPRRGLMTHPDGVE